MVAMIRTEMLVLGDRRLQWIEAGEPSSERVVVWLHAFPVSSAMWTDQLESVPAGWRMIAPDLAGFGGTTDHSGPPSIDDFAKDFDQLLESLRVRAAVLGGLSMGGYAAFAVHRLVPDRLRGLILADTKSGADTSRAREGREAMLQVVERRGGAGVADEMLPKLLGGTTRRARPAIEARVRALIEANPPDGLRRAIIRLRDRPDASSQLAKIPVPVLVLVGEEDAVTPVEDARAIADGAPDARLVILPEAGHLSNLENPSSFNAALRPWLAAV
jgi:pimeloyl-ACP methyl ester carboxylesterase